MPDALIQELRTAEAWLHAGEPSKALPFVASALHALERAAESAAPAGDSAQPER